MKRLFLAIPISGEVQEVALSLQKKLSEKTKAQYALVAPKNIHCTLFFFGELEETLLPVIRERFLSLRLAPFRVKFDQVGTFSHAGRTSVVWLGSRNLQLGQLLMATKKLFSDFRTEEREDLPHITLARVQKEEKKGEIRQLLSTVAPFPEMLVDTINLYESEPSKRGSKYTLLETFTLNAAS